AAGFVDAYDRAKARAGCLDFLDLLVRARNLVRDRPDVRRDFQRAIRYLLVDEFQDTDPLQLETVLGLAADGPPGSLFVVGDPKQSIYRFRRADIETYEAAKATIASRGAALTIRANFRSTRAILDAVNGVFEGVMIPPPDGAYQPAYAALEPSPKTEPGPPPVILGLSPDVPPATSAAEAFAQEARLVAAYLAREVERDRRFRYGDVALLFRAMTGVAAYEDALRAAGIPFRTVGGRHYYDRSEVGWTIAALAAIEDPHDPVALVGALRSPFFGITDEALLRLHAAGGEFSYQRPLPAGAEPGLAGAWALLGALHRERNHVAPAAVVERLLADTEVLAAYALEPQGEARVANLLKVLDTARALEATGALTFRGLVRWLRDRGAARYEEEESAVEAEDAVRLMTIHKAKGLEFPVVVVPDLGREASWRPPVVLADRASGRLAVNLGRLGDTALTTLDWAEAETREIQRVDAEALRVLYVALTRAERGLVLPIPARPEGKGFFQYLAALLDGPTHVLGAADLELPERAGGGPGSAAGPGETLEAWRAHHQALLARGAATDRVAAADDRGEAREPGRSARQ
ncbi:MAG: UvrD-helicase domain-containing protein, partial [Candidatus Rokuibacteriota bacterium]